MSVIIYVHKGDSFYLDSIFNITRKNNPSQKIILLGDDENKKYAEKYNLNFYHINDYYTSNFNYKHYSVNSPDYEKFCYERWLIINNFLKTHDYETIIYSDSDNAFFIDVNELLKYNENGIYDMMYLGNQNIIVPSLFILKKYIFEIISNRICDFFNKTDEDILKIIEIKNSYDNGRIHFSDMFLLNHILYNDLTINKIGIENKYNFKKTMNVLKIDDFLINVSYINIKDKLIIDNKIPYVNGVKLFNIHFAGDSKKEVHKFV